MALPKQATVQSPRATHYEAFAAEWAKVDADIADALGEPDEPSKPQLRDQ